MADEGTTEAVGDSKQEPQPAQGLQPEPRNAAAKAGGDSPFLGKLVAPKPTTPLNTDAKEAAPAQLPENLPHLEDVQSLEASIAQSLPENQEKTETPAPESRITRAVDALYGGNVVAEALNRETVAPNASKRSLKEIGLLPRMTDPGKEAPEVARPESSGDAGGGQGGLPKIRTYAADMSEEIKKRGETLSTIIGAEQGRVREEAAPAPVAPSPEVTRRFIMIAGAGILVLAGVAIVGGVFLFMPSGEEVSPRTPVIPPNATYSIEVSAETNLSRLLASERANAQINLGELAEIRVFENGMPMPASEFLTEFGAPPVLARNALDYMTGLHAFNRTQPFMLISIPPTSYDLAFEAMLEWERDMGQNLEAFFAPNGANPAAAPALNFVDRVYQNVDVRESGAEWRILYAFPRRDLLLITTNENTLKEVLTRLTLSSGE